MTPAVIVVYDTMLFYQTAVQTPPRYHATFRAIESGQVQLVLSKELFDEISEVLTRPELRAKVPGLTLERIASFLAKIASLACWVEDMPKRFQLPEHPDDDHLFNLAIAANADFLVTWENRLLELNRIDSPAARELRNLAPRLEILTPIDFLKHLRDRGRKAA